MMGFIVNGYNEIDYNRDLKVEYDTLETLAEKARPVIQFSKFQNIKDERGD